jgi:hypothetical protein
MMEISVRFTRHSMPVEGSAQHATICNPARERWLHVMRDESSESEAEFRARVRSLCYEHGGYVVWGGLQSRLESHND